jgi:Tfp pilus assembly protein PilO
MLKQKSPVFFRSATLTRFKSKFEPVVKNKKTHSYFTLTISFFTLTFFILFAIRPTLLTAVNLTKKVSDLKKLNIDYENKIGNIILAQIEYEQIRENLIYVEDALPKSSSFHSFARRIEEFANQSDLSISQFSIDPVPVTKPNSTGQYFGYGFSITGIGAYEDIFDFISHLTNWRRIVTIENLDISRQSGTVSGQLRMNLKGKTYYEP